MTTQAVQTLKKPLGLTGAMYRRAIVDSIMKLNPRWMVRNPVMFVVEVELGQLKVVGGAVTGAEQGFHGGSIECATAPCLARCPAGLAALTFGLWFAGGGGLPSSPCRYPPLMG